jgi:hypothetical protein
MLMKRHYGSVNKDRVRIVAKELNIRIPSIYLKNIENHDGGVPYARRFKYFDIDLNFEVGSCLGGFLCINPNQYGDLLSTYKDPPEFFPQGVIAFAEVGNGDYICFDYREGRDNPNPPIVYWNHEADIGKDVSFVAKDFETFIEMLKADDEI